MFQKEAVQVPLEWKPHERLIFRVLFIYFLLQAIPLDPKYYRNLFEIDWAELHYRDLFYIARYTPQVVSAGVPGSWGLNTLEDWAFILLMGVIGAGIWTYFDRANKQYNSLYYLLRVVLRYRLAIGIMAYGFIKIFPVQMPYPSLSLENTSYGDFTDWKITHLAYGVAPSFEIFLGAVEIFAALLLLNRKSASIGAAIIMGFVGNVFLSNLGYNGGEALYCVYLLSMAAVLVFYDVSRWQRIIMLGKPSSPNAYKPHFLTGWKKSARVWLRGACVFLFAVYSYLAYGLYQHQGYQYPQSKGLVDAAGLYNVREFQINGITLPYSFSDSVRWQDVVFEDWATISVYSNRSIKPDIVSTEEIFVKNEDRFFESTGSAGRQFYSYQVDTARKILVLRNKNRYHKTETWLLHYNRPDSETIRLNGLNEKGDSIDVVLDRLKKTYLLDESYKIPKSRSVFD